MKSPPPYAASIWCAYITVDPETHTHQKRNLILRAFPARKNHHYSEHDKKHYILITFFFCRAAFVKKDHYMAHCLAKEISIHVHFLFSKHKVHK